MSTGWLRLLLVLALGACYANALCIQPNAGQFGRRRLASGHMPRAGVVTAGIRLAGLKLERRPTFTVGQRVRVQRNIVFKHLPKLKDGFDAVGCEGTVIRTYDNAQISADRCAGVLLIPNHTLHRFPHVASIVV